MSEKKAPLYQGTPKLCNNGSICLRSSLLLCWGLASSPWWHAFVCFRGDKSPVWLLWMCFRSSDICDFHWQLQWWKHFNKTTHPELAMQLTNLSSRKLFFIPLLWSITGYLGLPKMLDVDWKMVQVVCSKIAAKPLSLQLFALNVEQSLHLVLLRCQKWANFCPVQNGLGAATLLRQFQSR